MARNVSPAARRAAYASQTGEAFLVLLALSHPQMAEPILVSSDAVNTYVGGDTYQPFPFQISMPSDTDDAPPRVQLTIDAVDRSIIRAVRGLSGAPITVTQTIVLGSSPDTIEAGPFTFDLREVEYDAVEISGSLQYADIINEPYPSETFARSTTPGAF